MAPESEIYASQGFGHQSGFGNRPALLIIDFTVGFANPSVFGGGNIAAAVERTKHLLDCARGAGIPVAFTRIVYADDGSDAGMFARKVPSLLRLTESEPDSQIVESLAPKPGELVVRKNQASAFFDTNLASWLIARHVDTVLVTGCTTSGCVRASVVDSVSHNFQTVVVSDCVGDRAEGPHEANLFDMRQKYADVVEADAVESYLRSLPGTRD